MLHPICAVQIGKSPSVHQTSCSTSLLRRPGPWEDATEDLDPFVDDPQDLLNHDIQFEVRLKTLQLDEKVLGVDGAPKYEDCFVRYKFDANDFFEPFTCTPEAPSGRPSSRQSQGDLRTRCPCQ